MFLIVYHRMVVELKFVSVWHTALSLAFQPSLSPGSHVSGVLWLFEEGAAANRAAHVTWLMLSQEGVKQFLESASSQPEGFVLCLQDEVGKSEILSNA